MTNMKELKMANQWIYGWQTYKDDQHEGVEDGEPVDLREADVQG